MRLNKLLLAGSVLALALTGCSKNQEPGQEAQQGATTYASITFSMPGSTLRAADPGKENYEGEWAGQDKINNVDIYVESQGTMQKLNDQTLVAIDAVPGTYRVAAWKTTAGTKTIYVVVNNGGAIETALDAAKTADAFKTAWNTAYDMVETNGELKAAYASVGADNKDVIMMTGMSAQVVINEGITEDAANTAASSANATTTAATLAAANVVKVDVNRIAARVLATLNGTSTSMEYKANTVKIADIKNIKWTVMQYEAKSYPGLQTNFASPAYAFVSAAYPDATNRTGKYSYGRTTLTAIKNYTRTATPNPKNQDEANKIVLNASDMKFVTETTHKWGDKGASDYRKGNSAYVLVEAQVEPVEAFFAVATDYTSWSADKTKDLYFCTGGAAGVSGKFYLKSTMEGLTGYAVDVAGKDNFIKFAAGKMYYYAWLNPNTLEVNTWENSPVWRNNIYHVNITGFNKLGFSADPLNPDTPTPDPDDPIPGTDEHLNDPETYMGVHVTVIKWGVNSYDIVL